MAQADPTFNLLSEMFHSLLDGLVQILLLTHSCRTIFNNFSVNLIYFDPNLKKI